MKKLLAILVLAAVMLPVSMFAASPVNTLFTATITTCTVSAGTATSILPDINLATVNVKAIDITNTVAAAQTITIYKNATTTTTVTAVYVFQVPATVGTYSIPLMAGLPNVWSSLAESVNIPYFGIRTSTIAASAATVNVKYWK